MPENHLCIRYWSTKQVQCTANGYINSALACPIYKLNVILQQPAFALATAEMSFMGMTMRLHV